MKLVCAQVAECALVWRRVFEAGTYTGALAQAKDSGLAVVYRERLGPIVVPPTGVAWARHRVRIMGDYVLGFENRGNVDVTFKLSCQATFLTADGGPCPDDAERHTFTVPARARLDLRLNMQGVKRAWTNVEFIDATGGIDDLVVVYAILPPAARQEGYRDIDALMVPGVWMWPPQGRALTRPEVKEPEAKKPEPRKSLWGAWFR